MDSSHLDQSEKSSPEISSDSSISEDSPDTGDIFGEPLIHPRVGDEYQAEIPPLLSLSKLLQDTHDSSLAFSMGPAIPVMWVSNKPYQVKDETIESANHGNAPSINESLESVNGKKSGSDFHLIVPGLSTGSWSDFETDWFLLGLYFFGKNLLQVSIFMDDKNMGQILSFYYGRFYRSPAYCKWSDCRKTRNKKCVLGLRFFTGYRQQEIFSRLFPHMSDESRTNLLEASRAFADGRRSLDEYVSTLKASVGIHVLVEAVGIGKGKDDLTALVIDSSKNNQIFTHRPEIPSGKACSSLTSAEIVKFLTGDFRLSKARSNDLFWEAVWPRLLARGWHSEQPKGDGYPGSKNSLVFLMPGIKKFSRRKLTKGDHYFDSVSDVLAKVASEPELLELEIHETQLNISEEKNGWAMAVCSDVDVDDDLSPGDRERHCYLKPRVSTGPSNLTKFTVVDTSLANEDNPCKVRELRSLPLEPKRSSNKSHRSRKSKVDSQPNDVQISASVHAKGVSSHIGESQRNHKNNLDPPRMPVDVNLPPDHKQRAIKLKFSRPVKSGLSNCPGQEPKKRRLTCRETDVAYVLSLPAKKKKDDSRAMNKNGVPPKKNQPLVEVSSSEAVATSTSKEKIPMKSFSGNCVGSEFSRGKEVKLETPEVIDLNLPQVPTKPEIVDYKVKVEHEQNEVKIDCDVVKSNDTTKCSDVDKPKCSEVDLRSEPKVKVEESENEVEQHSLVVRSNDTTLGTDLGSGPRENSATDKDHGPDQLPRRQSTRNRPLTTKALEALEIGLLKPVRTNRKRSTSTSQDQKSKRSRQPRRKSAIIPNIIVIEERGIDGTCNEKPQIMGDPHIGFIAVKKEVEASNPLRVSSFSCSEAP